MTAQPARAGAREKARAARQAALALQASVNEARTTALEAIGKALETHRASIEAANAEDVAAADAAVVAGDMSRAARDRLVFKEHKITQAVQGVREVAALPDPLGRTLRATLMDDDLKLFQVTVPIGVVACAFESRPDVVVQIAALGVRSGNAVLLKGGREAARTNQVVSDVIRAALATTHVPADAVQLVEGREELAGLLALDDLVDLMIPRGSSQFVRFVQSNTRIPVLGHAEGVCHVYVDKAANLHKALEVSIDAKVNYPAACNAAECILVHRDLAPRAIPELAKLFYLENVEVRASAQAHALAPDQTKLATQEDFGHEWGDLVCAMHVVDDLDDAIAFINRHGSRHTDAIVTEDPEAARRFVSGVDSASVMVNASTRFADGFRYGLGAEVGISTSKVHARGPVGMEGLTTTKWIVIGDGHMAGDYTGVQPRPFKHAPLDEVYHG